MSVVSWGYKHSWNKTILDKSTQIMGTGPFGKGQLFPMSERLCGEDQPGFCSVLQLRVSVTPDSTLSSLGAIIRHLQQGTMVAQLLAPDPKVTCGLRLPRKWAGKGKIHSHTSLFLLVTSPKVHMKSRLGNQQNPGQGRVLLWFQFPSL